MIFVFRHWIIIVFVAWSFEPKVPKYFLTIPFSRRMKSGDRVTIRDKERERERDFET